MHNPEKEKNQQLFIDACANGALTMVSNMLNDSNLAPCLEGTTFGRALMAACQHNQSPIVSHLLNPSLITKFCPDSHQYWSSGLRLACRHGRQALVKNLLDWAVENHSAGYTTTQDIDFAFMLACQYGHLETVKVLLSHPIFPTHGLEQLDTNWGLIYACQHGHLHLVEYLLKTPGVNTPDIHAMDDMPWSMALKHNHVNIIKFLIFDCNIPVTERFYEELGDRDEIRKMLQARELASKLQETLHDHPTQKKSKI